MMANLIPPDRIWAADTGMFSAPHRFSPDRYLAWLRRWSHANGRCLFATAPDVVGDAAKTLDVAMDLLKPIQREGYKVALVAQNGIENMRIPWESFDALFVGGVKVLDESTGKASEWKLSQTVNELVKEARQRGKWTHMGRCNSERRLRFAVSHHYQSADGTYIAFGPDINIPKVQRWIDGLESDPPRKEPL